MIEWGHEPPVPVQEPAPRPASEPDASTGYVGTLLPYLAGLTGADGLAVVLGADDSARVYARHNFRPQRDWWKAFGAAVGSALSGGETVRVAVETTLPDGRRARAASVTPLLSRGIAIGTLLALRVDESWTAEDEAGVARAAGLVALELAEEEELASAHRAVEAVESRARARDQIQRDIATAEDTDAIMELATKRLADLFGADGVSMMLVDRNGELVLRSAMGLGEDVARESRQRVGEGIAGWVAEHGEPLLLSGDVQDERFQGSGAADTSLIAPLLAGDRVLGVVNVKARGVEKYQQEQLNELASMAQDIGGAIARAESRRLIAQELHDGLAQELTAIVYTLESCQRALGKDTEVLRRQLAKATREARGCLADLRQFMTALRQQQGSALTLPVTLSRLIDDMRRASGLAVTYEATGRERELPSPVARSVVRIAQEGLRNIQQHAQARNIQLTLNYSERDVALTLRDDGVGFPAGAEGGEERGHYGLAGMRERAEGIGGTFSVHSSPGVGTMLEAVIPYLPSARGAGATPAWPTTEIGASTDRDEDLEPRQNLIGRILGRT